MLSQAQRVAMRLGALMCLLAVPILAVVAVVTAPDFSADEEIVWVAEGESEFELPEPGLFGGSSTVYGSVSTSERPSPADLDCRLLSEDGAERSKAKLRGLFTLGQPSITVDGTELSPLFEVSYARGDRVQCADLARVMPAAHTAPSTFGSASGTVFVTAVGGALTCLVVGVVGMVVLRPRP